jgi:uroporphyrin-III C-methyltransferase
MNASRKKKGRGGSLVVAGFGVRFAGHCTPEARAAITDSDIVYAVSGDAVAQAWLERLHPRTVSLHDLYGERRARSETYEAMVETIVDAVREGNKVCAVFYGHPGVYVYPSHEAIRRLRSEGFTAQMLPGISSEDCLFAYLGVDPGQLGCQSYEATDFLIHARRVEPTAALILWQIGVIGDAFLRSGPADARKLQVLTDVLREDYPDQHGVIVYEAATLPTTQPKIQPVPLVGLPAAAVTQQSTLYVPPREAPKRNARRVALLGASAR